MQKDGEDTAVGGARGDVPKLRGLRSQTETAQATGETIPKQRGLGQEKSAEGAEDESTGISTDPQTHTNMQKADGGTQAPDATRPGNTPNASLASSPSTFDPTLSQGQSGVNTEDMQKDGEDAAVGGARGGAPKLRGLRSQTETAQATGETIPKQRGLGQEKSAEAADFKAYVENSISKSRFVETPVISSEAVKPRNEAVRTRLKNKLRDQVRALNLSRKIQKGNEVSEAAAVQIYGETASALQMIENSRGKMEQRDGESYDDLKAKLTQLKRSNPNMDWDKERNSVEKFRGIYNDLFAQMNATRIANGYEPVDYRAGYFPHFSKKGGDGILDKFAAVLGITMEVQNLPTTM